jgi:hypothetical protein
LDIHFFELPHPSKPEAVACLVLKQEEVVFRGLLDGWLLDDRYGRVVRVRGEEPAGVEERAEGDVTEVCRCVVVAHYAVRQEREGLGEVLEKHLGSPGDPEAPAAVDVVDEHEFTAVAVRLFQGRELSSFGAEYLCRLFFVPCSLFVSCGVGLGA